jgi:hypothetical protein
MNTTTELSAFHNWCDHWCERCPLAAGCPIPGQTGALVETLERARAMLEEIAARRGISIDDLPPPAPPSIEARLLCDAGRAYALALCDLDLVREGALLAGKTARVASWLDEGDEEGWDMDVVPNLLLVEHLLAEADVEVARRGPRTARHLLERVQKTRRDLLLLLAPLLATIPESARRTLAVLVAAGCAPSPFVSRGTRSDR